MGISAGQMALYSGILRSGLQVGAGISGFAQSRFNAKILERRGKQLERARRIEGKKIAGAQRARFAASGVDPNTGTPAEVARKTLEESRIQALRDRFAFDSEALSQKNRGTLAALAGTLGAASTLLGATSREKQLDEGIKVINTQQVPATRDDFDPFITKEGFRIG